jgi:hypothetical protein
MKLGLAVLLIAVGAWLFMTGYNRRNSIAGAAADFGTTVANKFDGKTRTTEHTTYMVAGGAIALVGLVVAVRSLRGGT